jgi:hypothetical protein
MRRMVSGLERREENRGEERSSLRSWETRVRWIARVRSSSCASLCVDGRT